MKHKHLDGRVGHVVEKKQDTYTCLSIKQKHGVNEINLYLDDAPERATTEVFVDKVRSITVDVFEERDRDPETVKLAIRQPDDSVTFIYLDCRFDVLLAAVAAEQMAQQATRNTKELP